MESRSSATVWLSQAKLHSINERDGVAVVWSQLDPSGVNTKKTLLTYPMEHLTKDFVPPKRDVLSV